MLDGSVMKMWLNAERSGNMPIADKFIVGGQEIELADSYAREQLQSIVQRLIALEGGTVVTPDPPVTGIVGSVDSNNNITLTNLENGTYTLRYEDDNGILNGYDNIATVEVV